MKAVGQETGKDLMKKQQAAPAARKHHKAR